MSSLKKWLAWLIVIAALALYPWVAIAWFEVYPGGLITISWSIASAVPLLVYALLVLLCLPRSSARQRITGVGVLYAFHILSGTLAGAIYAFIGPIPFNRALTRAFLQVPPSLLLQIIWAPLALLPFRDLLLPQPRRDSLPAPLLEEAPPRTEPVTPLPPQQELDTLEIEDATPVLSAPGDTDDKIEAWLAALAAAEPVPALPAHGDAPEQLFSLPSLGGESDSTVETWSREEPVIGVEQAVGEQQPLASAPQEGGLWADGPALLQVACEDQPPPHILPTGIDRIPAMEQDDTAIRIPFERIAEQLPADAFLLPLDRLSSNLREPNQLLVPEQFILSQLPNGVVRVPWNMVAAQFPLYALTLTDSEMAQRFLNGGLLLPLDEVVGQLSPEVLYLPSRSVDLQGIEQFPAPFQPSFSTASSAVERPTEGLDLAQAAVPPLTSSSSLQPQESAGSVEVDRSIPEGTDYQGALGSNAEQLQDATAGAADLSRQIEQAQRISALFAPLGSPKADVQVVGEATLFVVSSPRFGKEALVAAATPLVPLLAGSQGLPPVDQATLRGADGAMVLTALAPVGVGGPVLVAGVHQRGSLALTEVLSGRVAAEYRANHSNLPAASWALASQGRHALAFESVVVPKQVERQAGSLEAFGPVVPSALRDVTDGTLLYLFLASGTMVQPFGSFVCDLFRILRTNDQPEGLAPFHSAVLRMGGQRVVMRLVAEWPGRVGMLVTAGSGMEQPGLAHLQVERVALHLSSC